MAHGRHFKNRLFTITQQPIVQFQCNFAKGDMACSMATDVRWQNV